MTNNETVDDVVTTTNELSSDNKSTSPIEYIPAFTPFELPKVGGFLEAPQGFVRGGTHTSGHDKMVAEAEADAERRRDEATAERKLARIPIDQGGAKLYENKSISFGQGGADVGHVLLKYMTAKGERMYDHGEPVECLADIRVVEGSELALILVCPRCLYSGVPQGQCQIQVRQKNRSWHLDSRTAGNPIVFEGRMVTSCGIVMESERFACMQCGWSAKIDKNNVRPVP